MMNKVKIDHMYFLTVDLVLFCYEAHIKCVVVCTGLEKSLKLCHILENSLKMKSLVFVVKKSLYPNPQALKFVHK